MWKDGLCLSFSFPELSVIWTGQLSWSFGKDWTSKLCLIAATLVHIFLPFKKTLNRLLKINNLDDILFDYFLAIAD